MTDSVSNKQLYEAIMEVHKKIDEIVEKRISPLEMWKSELMGKLAVIGLILTFGINIAFDWIKEKFRI